MTTTYLNSPDDLTALVASMPAVAMDAAEGAMTQTLLFLHGQLPGYPEGPKEKVSQHWTPKQRAYFFWALRKGLIQVPYQRTGTLGRSFTTQVERGQDAVTGELGTNVAYAPWVVGPAYPGEDINGQTMYQARIHAGLWWSLGNEFDKTTPQAVEIFADEFFNRFMAGL
jgi:hypothetical protein